MRRILIVALLVGLALGTAIAAASLASPARPRQSTTLLMGDARVGRHAQWTPAGRAVAFEFTARRSGVAQVVHVFLERSTRAHAISAAVYRGEPASVAVVMARGMTKHLVLGAWNQIRIRPVHVTHGQGYWIAVLGLGGQLTLAQRKAGPCRGVRRSRTILRSLPASWQLPPSPRACVASVYATGRMTASLTAPATGGGGGGSGGSGGGGSGGVTTAGTTTGPTQGPLRTSSCFSSPGACGYPDPGYGNVGPSSPCAQLQPSGSVVASTAGQVVQNLDVTGTISVTAPSVTINNVCVTTDGGGALGSVAISLTGAAANTLIENTTVQGADGSGHSLDSAAMNRSGNQATLSHDYFFNCGECVHDGPWTVDDSYIIANGMQGTSDHYEDVYCSDETVVMGHDTLLNPEGQVAEVFCDTNGGSGGACDNHVTISNSLLAGGGYLVYPCGNASSAGSSTMDIVSNRFARCITPPLRQTSDGGWDCQGSLGEGPGAGADGNGYWPNGGHYGVDSYTFCPPAVGQTWANNVWDDNGAPEGC